MPIFVLTGHFGIAESRCNSWDADGWSQTNELAQMPEHYFYIRSW